MLVVGGGPGRARLRDPLRAAARGGSRDRRAARRRAARGRREGQAAGLAPAVGRGGRPAFAASGCSGDGGLDDMPDVRAGAGKEQVYVLTRRPGAADPDAADDAQPRQRHRVAVAARTLARRARRSRRRDGPARDVGGAACSSTTAASSACAPATRAAASHGEELGNFEPGSDIVATRDRARRGHARAPHQRRARPLRPARRRRAAGVGARREGGVEGRRSRSTA